MGVEAARPLAWLRKYLDTGRSAVSFAGGAQGARPSRPCRFDRHAERAADVGGAGRSFGVDRSVRPAPRGSRGEAEVLVSTDCRRTCASWVSPISRQAWARRIYLGDASRPLFKSLPRFGDGWFAFG